jgi:hypothetical protein
LDPQKKASARPELPTNGKMIILIGMAGDFKPELRKLLHQP